MTEANEERLAREEWERCIQAEKEAMAAYLARERDTIKAFRRYQDISNRQANLDLGSITERAVPIKREW